MDWEDYEQEKQEELEAMAHDDAQIKDNLISESVKKLGSFFDISKDMLGEILANISKDVAMTMRRELMSSMRSLVEKECGKLIKEMAKDELKNIFLDVISSQVVIAEVGWKEKRLEIKEIIFNEYQEKLKSFYGKDEVNKLAQRAVRELLEKDLQSMSKDAIEQFKKDLSDEVNKNAMQNITKAIAGAISSDSKLLAILKA